MFTVDHHSRVACRWLNSFTSVQHQFEVKTTPYYSNTVAPVEK
jgi:hypothetical protein